MINVDDVVCSATAQISKYFSLKLHEMLILLKYRFLQTKRHASLVKILIGTCSLVM
jgi:hypothetical protein